jgi:hypothetical protein
MPVIIDEFTADVTSPAPTPGPGEIERAPADRAPTDFLALQLDLQLLAERAARLSAD